MYELTELRHSIETKDYSKALTIIDELEAMSLEDKISRIYSYGVILLIHLIKQSAEQKTTRSWENSIKNSVFRIKKTNKRRKADGYYLQIQELAETLEEAFEEALREASLEAFGGAYSELQILEKINKQQILNDALDLIKPDDN
ncbi:DUF29 family protein [Pleurocapsa sp. PCC 7319]|uniref:DUF29 family protein n=1 Tax=Pleurocapsa sp. PCC 7319 TaxID=118161 RepID=UPI00034A0EF8|nr:DUF29 family protein [Pleurocapsa sp. PCC 7319]